MVVLDTRFNKGFCAFYSRAYTGSIICQTIPRLDLDVDDGLDGSTLEADGVDGLEQRVRVRSLSGDEEVVDLLGGQSTLQELSVEVVLSRFDCNVSTEDRIV